MRPSICGRCSRRGHLATECTETSNSFGNQHPLPPTHSSASEQAASSVGHFLHLPQPLPSSNPYQPAQSSIPGPYLGYCAAQPPQPPAVAPAGIRSGYTAYNSSSTRIQSYVELGYQQPQRLAAAADPCYSLQQRTFTPHPHQVPQQQQYQPPATLPHHSQAQHPSQPVVPHGQVIPPPYCGFISAPPPPVPQPLGHFPAPWIVPGSGPVAATALPAPPPAVEARPANQSRFLAYFNRTGRPAQAPAPIPHAGAAHVQNPWMHNAGDPAFGAAFSQLANIQFLTNIGHGAAHGHPPTRHVFVPAPAVAGIPGHVQLPEFIFEADNEISEPVRLEKGSLFRFPWLLTLVADLRRMSV